MRGAVVAVAATLAGAALAAGGGPDRPHHAADGFRNPDPGYVLKSGEDVRKWRRERAQKGIPDADAYQFEMARNDTAFLRDNRTKRTATWIGHATMLLQFDGVNVLTDPQFSERSSPVQWFGPKRAAPPGVALDDLPPIDLVVVSHDHYDSLDRNTIRSLRQRPGGDQTLFAVPLGLAEWFRGEGIDNVRELDWWESTTHGRLQITATPAQHWSQRNLFGRNKTLWCGFVIAAPDYRVYFAGDSGYAPLFGEIGSALGPFDLALIPIGAYAPRWFMQPNHVNPEEAILAHKDVSARKSIAIHWGTFVLSDEPLTEPPVKLEEARLRLGIPADEFIVLKHGETRMLDATAAAISAGH